LHETDVRSGSVVAMLSDPLPGGKWMRLRDQSF
jgi:hypothetical protein